MADLRAMMFYHLGRSSIIALLGEDAESNRWNLAGHGIVMPEASLIPKVTKCGRRTCIRW
jgi:hypothetical protein